MRTPVVLSICLVALVLGQSAPSATELAPKAGDALLEAASSREFRAALEANALGNRTHTLTLPVEPLTSLPSQVDKLTLSLALAGWRLRDQAVLTAGGTSTHLVLVFERQVP